MSETDLSEQDQRERRRAQLVQLRSSSIWIVFLTIPAALVKEHSEAGPTWDWIAYSAIAVFAIVYVAGFLVVPRGDLLRDADEWPRPGRFVVTLLVLLALASLMIPSLQGSVISILPFFAGYGLFLFPIHWGLLWTAVTVLIMFSVLGAFDTGFDFGLFIGPLLSIGFVVVIRVMFEWGAVEERAKMELAAVQEREAVSRDVHDILGHTLTVVSLKTQLARRTLREDPGRAEAELDQVLIHAQTALDEVRATVGRLRTPELAEQISSAKTALDTKDIALTVRGRADEVAVNHRALFAWAIREAVTNVVRHAQASRCTILLDRNSVAIIDNGIGLQHREGNGLSGLRRRIEDAGGALYLGPAPSETTKRGEPATVRQSPGTKLEVRFA